VSEPTRAGVTTGAIGRVVCQHPATAVIPLTADGGRTGTCGICGTRLFLKTTATYQPEETR
jgi:hypothetical protein